MLLFIPTIIQHKDTPSIFKAELRKGFPFFRRESFNQTPVIAIPSFSEGKAISLKIASSFAYGSLLAMTRKN